jgi:hypothetical protein
MLAGGRIKTFLKWSKIRKVKFNDKQHTILLKAGFSDSIAVFCTTENYEDIKALIHKSTSLTAHADLG